MWADFSHHRDVIKILSANVAKWFDTLDGYLQKFVGWYSLIPLNQSLSWQNIDIRTLIHMFFHALQVTRAANYVWYFRSGYFIH